MIKGGYVLQARKTDNSPLSHKPPHFREIFNWLYRQANYKDNCEFKRGQCFRSIKDIQEGLKWYIGYRKMMYSKSQCENALNWLRNETMITTAKTTRGMFITICNYDTYQDPLNYECNSEQTAKTTTKTETPVHYKQEGINKENKEKNVNKYSEQSPEVELSKLLFSLMTENGNGIKEPDFQKWAKHIDLMIRVDKIPEQNIRGAIHFSQTDQFWKTNILSTSSLRDKYPKLLAKINSIMEKQNGKQNSKDGSEYSNHESEYWDQLRDN